MIFLHREDGYLSPLVSPTPPCSLQTGWFEGELSKKVQACKVSVTFVTFKT